MTLSLSTSRPGFAFQISNTLNLEIVSGLLTILRCKQTAGLLPDTARKAALLSRLNCGSAWMHRYVIIPSRSFHIVDISNELLPHIEIQGAEEEHRQLPPHENVPQGCWPAEEGRCSRLKCFLHWIVIVYPDLAAEASCPPGVLGSF